MAPSAKTQYLGYHMVYDCEEGFDVPMSAFERQHHRERHRPAAKPGAPAVVVRGLFSRDPGPEECSEILCAHGPLGRLGCRDGLLEKNVQGGVLSGELLVNQF